ncbi:hypothetical protein C2845_PM09G03660 [Panicum miliaceum]|uniref:Uncharacterized protein n=1 Tax=Panicum miliaceum TaxID=4540 RepID=A0A3L6RY02_PANMI|nr:hypothetical protein C2845_PM09G03660 [Panicum miliaceum]
MAWRQLIGVLERPAWRLQGGVTRGIQITPAWALALCPQRPRAAFRLRRLPDARRHPHPRVGPLGSGCCDLMLRGYVLTHRPPPLLSLASLPCVTRRACVEDAF